MELDIRTEKLEKSKSEKANRFSKKYKTLEFWETDAFTDESGFDIHGHDGRTRVRWKPNTAQNLNNLVDIFRHSGGGVLVWGVYVSFWNR